MKTVPSLKTDPKDRRTSRRNPVQVKLELSDMRGTFSGRTVDVSRGGLFCASKETRPVGSLLRVRVLGPKGESVMAVGVVVRLFDDVETSSESGTSLGMAIALTSTNEGWDRFWDDVAAEDDENET